MANGCSYASGNEFTASHENNTADSWGHQLSFSGNHPLTHR